MENFEQKKERIKSKVMRGKKKTVVNAGLLKAGKSSLFNALLGRSAFKTDVVRATVKNQEEIFDNYILLDTPGLDACDKDTNVAIDGYRNADAILFVHNLQEGEFNQIEIESIKKISSLYDNDDIFYKNVILVLTHKDQVENNYKNIRKKIDKQCKEILHNQFYLVFCVDSVGYLKGFLENKILLMEDSGILELKEAIEKCISDEFDLRNTLIDKEKRNFIQDIENEIKKIKTSMPAIDKLNYNISTLEKMAKEVETELEMTKNIIQNKKFELNTNKSYRYEFRKDKSYDDFSSESQAKSAAKSAIENTTHRIARSVKIDALNIVSNAENYIVASGVPLQLRIELSNSYEKVRKNLQKNGITIVSNFDIKINIQEGVLECLRYARSRARDIDDNSFSSANYYATMYSSDLYIECNSREVYVEGLFGGKFKRKNFYSYDARGAMDNINEDAAKLIEEVKDEIYEPNPNASQYFEKIKIDLKSQYDKLMRSIIKELNDAIYKEKLNKQKMEESIKSLSVKINKLEALKNEVESF